MGLRTKFNLVMLLRDRQDEAIGILKRLFAGERISHKGDWFQLNDAQLQILPYQEDLPMAAASSLSPSGMQLAGKYGMGVLSIASTSQEGLQALPTQWSFAEEAARKHDQKVDRRNWRVVMAWHLAESKKQAEQEAVDGLQHWHNEYNVRVLGRPGSIHALDEAEQIRLVQQRAEITARQGHVGEMRIGGEHDMLHPGDGEVRGSERERLPGMIYR